MTSPERWDAPRRGETPEVDITKEPRVDVVVENPITPPPTIENLDDFMGGNAILDRQRDSSGRISILPKPETDDVIGQIGWRADFYVTDGYELRRARRPVTQIKHPVVLFPMFEGDVGRKEFLTPGNKPRLTPKLVA